MRSWLMRILLDESVPRDLGKELVGHHVRTVQQVGWAGLQNGELLKNAREQFDVMITGDQNMEYQQNPAGLQLPVVILVAANNRIESLRPLVPKLLDAIAAAKQDGFYRVSA